MRYHCLLTSPIFRPACFSGHFPKKGTISGEVIDGLETHIVYKKTNISEVNFA